MVYSNEGFEFRVLKVMEIIEKRKREKLVLYSGRSFVKREDAFSDDIIDRVRSQPNPVMSLSHNLIRL